MLALERLAFNGAMLRRLVNRYGAYSALLVTAVMAAVLMPRFYTLANLVNVVQQSAALGLVSVGQPFVILAAGIDLSVGSAMGLSMVVAAAITGGANALVAPAIAGSLALGGVIGLANGLLVTVRNVPPFVATLGMLVFVDGTIDEDQHAQRGHERGHVTHGDQETVRQTNDAAQRQRAGNGRRHEGVGATGDRRGDDHAQAHGRADGQIDAGRQYDERLANADKTQRRRLL